MSLSIQPSSMYSRTNKKCANCSDVDHKTDECPYYRLCSVVEGGRKKRCRNPGTYELTLMRNMFSFIQLYFKTRGAEIES